MLNISSFFDKFKNAALKEAAIRQSIIDAIKKAVGMDPGITLNDVELKNKIIRIRAGSAVKNQIFIKKESILRDIREANPGIVITEIR